MNVLTPFERHDHMVPSLFRGWPRALVRTHDELQFDIRIDVDENDKEYLVRAEIPGARKEDVHVAIDSNYVSISVEFKKDDEKRKGRTLLSETYRGSVTRGFSLGNEVDESKSTAALDHGVLHLTLMKRQGTAKHTLIVT